MVSFTISLQDIVFMPVTTACSHNICLPCLKRSFDAETFSCSACRLDWIQLDLNSPWYRDRLSPSCTLASNSTRPDIAMRMLILALFFREELPKDLAKESNVNKEARAALNKIFPGYEVGRWIQTFAWLLKSLATIFRYKDDTKQFHSYKTKLLVRTCQKDKFPMESYVSAIFCLMQ